MPWPSTYVSASYSLTSISTNMKNTFLTIPMSTLMLLWAACGQNPAPQTEAAASTELATADYSLTTLQVKTAGVVWGNPGMDNVLSTYGTVLTGELTVHPEHMAVVTPLGEGVLVKWHIARNQMVQKGAVLATVRHPELLNAQQDYLETQAKMSFLQAEYDRYRVLKEADAGALKLFQQADAEQRTAQTRLAALEARLRLYSIDPAQLNTTNLNAEMRLRAPVSGVVIDIMASPGTFLSPGQPLCTISDRSQMHADFWLYEKDRHAIKLKQAVLVQMAGEAAINGSVVGIDPVVDPNQHAIRVHVQGAWPAHWPQGAYVTAQLESSTAPQNAMLLPDEAVMQQDEGHFIFVYVRADSASVVFEKIPVLVQRNTKGQLLVVPQLALPAGALPVLKGAYYIAANAAGVTIEE